MIGRKFTYVSRREALVVLRGTASRDLKSVYLLLSDDRPLLPSTFFPASLLRSVCVF
jgi:hypothetical protein